MYVGVICVFVLYLLCVLFDMLLLWLVLMGGVVWLCVDDDV